MDFIEKIFGISPDGGDGSLEMTLVLILPVAVLLIGFIWRHRRSAGTNTHP
jgi:heme/copper-type cytochrome/quinol oxidase subunit 2